MEFSVGTGAAIGRGEEPLEFRDAQDARCRAACASRQPIARREIASEVSLALRIAQQSGDHGCSPRYDTATPAASPPPGSPASDVRALAWKERWEPEVTARRNDVLEALLADPV